MKISKTLPQFSEESALFIVAGLYEADFYLASEGEINQVDSFTVAISDPAIKKGFKVRESGGAKHLKQMRQADFLKTFKTHLTAVINKQPAKLVYLFAPTAVAKELTVALPVALKKTLRTFKGNFHKEHPFKLLEKIGKRV